MSNLRIIARLDIKGANLIKGIRLEGLRVVGEPQEFALKYYEAGVDEIIYVDTVASLYGRNNLTDILEKTAQNVFVPITVGGGIRSLDDVRKILRAGADKVTINTAVVSNPNLISDVSRTFGAQCMVLSIQAKSDGADKWEAYTDNGREHTGLDVVEWAKKGESLGAGEIMLTSVDREGTQKGFDLDLVKRVSTAVNIPVIASGGMGCLEDFIDVVNNGKADAVAVAHVLHYNKCTVDDIRVAGITAGFHMRKSLKQLL